MEKVEVDPDGTKRLEGGAEGRDAGAQDCHHFTATTPNPLHKVTRTLSIPFSHWTNYQILSSRKINLKSLNRKSGVCM